MPSNNTKMTHLRRHPHAAVPIHIIDTATSVDCTRDAGLRRRSLRSFVECLMAPYCCGLHLSSQLDQVGEDLSVSAIGAVLTGTFFGLRRRRVSFCLQQGPRGSPLLLVELAMPTAFLAREMQQGLLRIALKHCGGGARRPAASGGSPLFSVPVWSMYCNGRKVGYAVRRVAGEGDLAVLRTMQTVSVGAGVLPAADGSGGGGGDLMYMRARFERVVGSVDSESFHMINPVGSTGQELSIFLLRS